MPDPKQEWLQRFAQRHGRGTAAAPAQTAAPGPATGGRPPQAPPPTIIAGASGVQNSYGDVTNQGVGNTQSLPHAPMDFTEATAQQAGTDIGSNPTQSPALRPSQGYALRYGVGFLCYNYATWDDLSDIQGYAQPTSLYRQAFQGMNRSEQYENPRSADILAKIQLWIDNLARDLPANALGQLVVTFQGHGLQGNIYGVDERPITPSQLQGLFRAAQGRRIHVNYVPDTCRSGNAVPAFQEGAADYVDERTRHVEGAGNQSSPENHANAQAMRDQLTAARELINMNRHLGSFESRMDDVEAACRPPNNGMATLQAWQEAINFNNTVKAHVRQMRGYTEANLLRNALPELRVDRLITQFGEATTALNGLPQPPPATQSFDFDIWRNAIGRLQDQVSDAANSIIETLDRRIQAAGG